MYLVSSTCVIIVSISLSSGQFTISGPGLSPDTTILPCRHFFIQSASNSSVNVNKNDLEDDNQRICRAHTELLQISAGYFLVRYKLYYSCHHIKISVKLSRELSHGESQCWCHYVVKDGHVYRQVRLNMFWDSVLAWLARRS